MTEPVLRNQPSHLQDAQAFLQRSCREEYRNRCCIDLSICRDFVRFNPHFHGIVPEGGFDEQVRFNHVPLGNLSQMSAHFRLINQKLAQNLLTWKHSGFSVGNKVKIPAFSQKAREALSQYLVKPHEYENLHYVIRLVPSGWKQEHLDPPESEKTLPEEYPECSAPSKQSRSAYRRCPPG